jgi:hypothetical protein
MLVDCESVIPHDGVVPPVIACDEHVKAEIGGLPLWLKRLFSCGMYGQLTKVTVYEAPF